MNDALKIVGIACFCIGAYMVLGPLGLVGAAVCVAIKELRSSE